ncbi:hypothetical protein BJY00DRAFT_284091 [Aspergillus carlsbadensis]|nr:hypothetical protein BJY00DRAFT_284091 [Aspergillus carlsbadensis]
MVLLHCCWGAGPIRNVRCRMSGKTLLGHAMEMNPPAAVAALLGCGKLEVPVEGETVDDTDSNGHPGPSTW